MQACIASVEPHEYRAPPKDYDTGFEIQYDEDAERRSDDLSNTKVHDDPETTKATNMRILYASKLTLIFTTYIISRIRRK